MLNILLCDFIICIKQTVNPMQCISLRLVVISIKEGCHRPTLDHKSTK